ncbi:MAG: hypothetical protein ACRAVC_20245 [Trichormus sp.]
MIKEVQENRNLAIASLSVGIALKPQLAIAALSSLRDAPRTRPFANAVGIAVNRS